MSQFLEHIGFLKVFFVGIVALLGWVLIPKETKKEVVTTSTDTKKINTEWQLLAEEGSAMAQYK